VLRRRLGLDVTEIDQLLEAQVISLGRSSAINAERGGA
jgi:hypothetical protein